MAVDVPDYIQQLIDHDPISVFIYNRLPLLIRIAHPTIYSAYKAGYLGEYYPIKSFPVNIVTESTAYPNLTAVLNPASENWADEVHEQVARHLNVRTAVVVGGDNKPLEDIGLDYVYVNRGRHAFRVDYTREPRPAKKIPTRSSGAGRSKTFEKYLDVAIMNMEEQLAKVIFSVIDGADPAQWVAILAQMAERANALNLANTIVVQYTHVEDGRSMKSILASCGFTDVGYFVRQFAYHITYCLNALITAIGQPYGSRGFMNLKLMMHHFYDSIRNCKIAAWLRSLYLSRVHHITNINIQTNTMKYVRPAVYSSDDEDGSDDVSGSSSSGEEDEKSSQICTRFIESQAFVGAFHGKGIARTGSVSFRLLRAEDFVKRSSMGAVPDAAYVRFSKLGTTEVQPGDIIAVKVRKASSDPVSPQGGAYRRGKGYLKKAARMITRSKVQAPPQDQFVRIDVVRYDRSDLEKRRKQWTVLSSVVHKRADQDYMGMRLVVPFNTQARFAFITYENTLGSTNEWIYRNTRVFDFPKGGVSKSKRVISYNMGTANLYVANNLASIGKDLLAWRFVGFPPFPTSGASADVGANNAFPMVVGNPEDSRTAPSCIQEAWAFFNQRRGTISEASYWSNFAQDVVYPKARRAANVLYAINKNSLPFPGVSTQMSPAGIAEYANAPPRGPDCAGTSTVSATDAMQGFNPSSTSGAGAPIVMPSPPQKPLPPPRPPRDAPSSSSESESDDSAETDSGSSGDESSASSESGSGSESESSADSEPEAPASQNAAKPADVSKIAFDVSGWSVQPYKVVNAFEANGIKWTVGQSVRVYSRVSEDGWAVGISDLNDRLKTAYAYPPDLDAPITPGEGIGSPIGSGKRMDYGPWVSSFAKPTGTRYSPNAIQRFSESKGGDVSDKSRLNAVPKDLPVGFEDRLESIRTSRIKPNQDFVGTSLFATEAARKAFEARLVKNAASLEEDSSSSSSDSDSSSSSDSDSYVGSSSSGSESESDSGKPVRSSKSRKTKKSKKGKGRKSSTGTRRAKKRELALAKKRKEYLESRSSSPSSGSDEESDEDFKNRLARTRARNHSRARGAIATDIGDPYDSFQQWNADQSSGDEFVGAKKATMTQSLHGIGCPFCSGRKKKKTASGSESASSADDIEGGIGDSIRCPFHCKGGEKKKEKSKKGKKGKKPKKGGSTGDEIGLDRNILTEERLASLNLMSRLADLAARRGSAKAEEMAELARNVQVLHCMNDARVKIFRRTLVGKLSRTCMIQSELDSGVLKPVWSGRFLSDGVTPLAAYDADAVYFFRLPMEPIDNDALVVPIYESSGEFFSALLYVVTKNSPTAEADLEAAIVACGTTASGGATTSVAPIVDEGPALTCRQQMLREWKAMLKFRAGEWAGLNPKLNDEEFQPTKQPPLTRGQVAGGPEGSHARADALKLGDGIADLMDGVEVEAEVEDQTQVLVLNERENVKFLKFWTLAITKHAQKLFGALDGLFRPSTTYVVVVPSSAAFRRWIKQVGKNTPGAFSKFLRDHTVVINSDFKTYNRVTPMTTVGNISITLRTKFRPLQNRMTMRINNDWNPIERLPLPAGVSNVTIYAVSHPTTLTQ